MSLNKVADGSVVCLHPSPSVGCSQGRGNREQSIVCEEKLLRVWVCPKESQSFLCSLGFFFGIEVVKNSEWACVFCIAVIGRACVFCTAVVGGTSPPA